MQTLVRLPRAGWAVVLVSCAWLAVHLLAANIVADSVFDGGLLGTDSYMRLVRVDELASGGGWFDSTIDRSNAPFGDELHWTRPFDVLLLGLALPLSLVLGFDDALFVAGATISPLIHLVMTIALVWAAVPIVGRGRAPMAAVVLLVQPAVIGHTIAGQADHHSLQLLLLVLEIGLLARLLAEPGRPRIAIAAGMVAGLGIWISAEMTILAGFAAATLVAAWVYDPGARLRALTWFGLGLTGTVALAIVTERLPADWLTVEYDRVSVAHLAAASAVLAVACGLYGGRSWAESVRGRIALAGAVGALATAPLALLFAGLLEGPGAQVSPAIEPIWLDFVSELQPLLPTDGESFGKMLLYVGPALICLPVAVVATWRASDDQQLLWASTAALLGLYVVLSLLHLRFASFAGVLLAIVSAAILGDLRDWLRSMPVSLWRRLAWVGAAVGLSVGFTLGGGVVTAASSEARDPDALLGCSRAAFDALEVAGEPSDVTFAHINVGPELLYRTDLAIVAGPYHRNDEGILDLHHFFASSDDELSRGLATDRGGRFVLVCDLDTRTDLYAASGSAPSLHTRLMAGDPPEWLRPVVGSEDDSSFTLYEVEADR